MKEPSECIPANSSELHHSCRTFMLWLNNFCSIDSVNDTYQVIVVTSDTSVDDVMLMALKKFALDPKDINRYRMVEVSLEKGGKVICTFTLNSRLTWTIFTFTSCSWAHHGQSGVSLGNHKERGKGNNSGKQTTREFRDSNNFFFLFFFLVLLPSFLFLLLLLLLLRLY